MLTQDRRVRRTQQMLAKALIALTLEKGYEHVTIREITERADVGYATFFRHYHDKDELLQDVLDVVLEEITGLMSLTVPDNDSVKVGVLLFRFVQSQSEIVRVLLGSRAVLQKLTAVVTAQIIGEQEERNGSTVPLEVAANHIVTSSIALIEWWLNNNMPYSPEQMGLIYHELIAEPASRIAFAP